MALEIIRIEGVNNEIISYEADKIETYYKYMILIGAIMLGLGLIV